MIKGSIYLRLFGRLRKKRDSEAVPDFHCGVNKCEIDQFVGDMGF